jgi:hypothetical protein
MAGLPILRTPRCTLRPWLQTDSLQPSAIANPRDISWNTSHRFPHPFEAHHQADQGSDSWLFAVLHEDKPSGGCGA